MTPRVTAVLELVPVLVVAGASRVLVVLAGRFGHRHVPWDPTSPTDAALAPTLFHWDALRYVEIATHGYTSEALTAHFPLYPLLAAAIARGAHVPERAALLGVANVAFVAAACLLYVVGRHAVGARAATIAVATMSFFPSTVFLSAAYPESLFLALSLVVFLALERGHLSVAAAVAGLAAACRPFGVLLALPVVLDAWRRRDAGVARPLLRCAMLAVLSVWGLLAYLAYLAAVFGNAAVLAGPLPPPALGEYLPWRLLGAAIASGSREAVVNVAFFTAFLVVTVLAMRRLPDRYTAFSLGMLALLFWRAPYFAQSPGYTHLAFASVHRYVIAVAPLHLSVAALIGERSGLAVAWLGLSAGLSVFWTALYAQGYVIR